MDLTSPWILYITLLALVAALFHPVFKALLKEWLPSGSSQIALSFVFLAIRYGWSSAFFIYLVLFTKNAELTGGYLSVTLAILFCALAIDLMRYGYKRARQRASSIHHLQRRLQVVEARLKSLEYNG
jgi:CBS domain containing-hemolysin-like protein